MKSLSKLVSAILLLALALAAFPAMGAGTAQAAACDWAGFVADVTVPDGTTYAPGATFQKTWRLRNIGYCTWNTSYAIVFNRGEQMGAPASKPFPQTVAPGETVDLTLDMTAPTSPGHYFGYYKLRNAAGVIFGIGSTANKEFWVEIYVGSPSGTGYDFTAHANEAVWSSGAGVLPFPGTDGDARGFGLKQDNPQFEGGGSLGTPGLLMSPQNLYNGYIQAAYPPIPVRSGDRFQTTIGCEINATSCYVAYRLDYQIGSGPVRTFWNFHNRERYEGLTYFVDVNLNALAGNNVKFILFMSAYGSPIGDRAIWGNPVIKGVGGTVPPTVTGTPPTPTMTSTAPTSLPTIPASSCDKVQFIRDVTVPDGTSYAAGTPFNKTWALKNVGSCTWTKDYQLVFYSGAQMSAPDALVFPQSVAPGQILEITVPMVAPATAGHYRGYWMFKNASGALFGFRYPSYNQPWWVDINVYGSSSGPTATPTATVATPTATGTVATATSTATPTATVETPTPSATPTVTDTPPTPQ
jgi:hypothetical protein